MKQNFDMKDPQRFIIDKKISLSADKVNKHPVPGKGIFLRKFREIFIQLFYLLTPRPEISNQQSTPYSSRVNFFSTGRLRRMVSSLMQ